MMNNYYFYDTSALLRAPAPLPPTLALSTITLEELEAHPHILASLRNYEPIIFKNSMLDPIIKADLPINNNTRIIASALAYDKLHPDEVQFVTASPAQAIIANLFFGNDSIKKLP